MPHIQVTLSQALADLSAEYEGSPFWTSVEATFAFNEALRMWNLLTSMWNERVIVPTRYNQVYYNLPQSMVYGARVEWNGTPLTRTSLYEMDAGRPGWENQTIDSGGNAPTRPIHWMPVGVTQFAIWPADTADDNSLTVDGVNRTPHLSIGYDYLDIGQEEYDAILGYALHYLAFKGNKEYWRGTMPLHKKFFQAAFRKNSRLGLSALFRQYIYSDTEPAVNPTVS